MAKKKCTVIDARKGPRGLRPTHQVEASRPVSYLLAKPSFLSHPSSHRVATLSCVSRRTGQFLAEVVLHACPDPCGVSCGLSYPLSVPWSQRY